MNLKTIGYRKYSRCPDAIAPRTQFTSQIGIHTSNTTQPMIE